jgi:hypothetical protein
VSRAASVPVIVVLLPLEGQATAHVVCGTWEEEQRVWAEVGLRDSLGEIESALRLLLDAFDDRRGAA